MNAFITTGRKAISAFIAVLMFVLSLTSYFSMEVSAVNTLKGYSIFDAQTGEVVSNYYLDANPYEENSRTPIVPDTRYHDYDLEGVVKIITTDGTTATGFVVDAHTIATAAHVVFDKENGSVQNSNVAIEKILIVTEDEDGQSVIKKTITNMYDVHVPNAYISSDDAKSRAYDYAMITVPNDSEGEDLSNYACFNLGVMTDGMIDSSTTVYCTGFPTLAAGELGNFDAEINIKYTGEGHIVKEPASDPERRFCLDADTSSGNSGGPVYIKTTYTDRAKGEEVVYYTVIGIYTRSLQSDDFDDYEDAEDAANFPRNGGVQMTTETLHFYKNNPYIEWGT